MTKINLFAEKLKEKEFYLTRAQLNKKYGVVPPSVTKIIQASKTKRSQEYVKKLLRDRNSPFAKATAKGQKFHKAVETGVASDAFTEKLIEVFKKDVIVDIDEVWGQEKSIIHKEHFYGGTFDGVGIYKGKLTLFDYKKTNKMKKNNSSMRNYLIQVCAYKRAHEAMYPDLKIEQVALFNLYGKTVDEVGTNIKVLNQAEIDEHTDRFYQHLFDFQTGKSTPYGNS
jgi:ATP-dependent exoDNAse (exonuclease V) beta subunit